MSAWFKGRRGRQRSSLAAHGSYTVTLADAVAMSNESDTSCQGLFFAVSVTVAAASAAGTTPASPAAGTL